MKYKHTDTAVTATDALEPLKSHTYHSPDEVFVCLQKALCIRYSIQEIDIIDFYTLGVISVKKKAHVLTDKNSQELESKIKRYDCHRTNLVIQMKNLFIMFVERELEICLNDDDVICLKDLHQMAQLVSDTLKNRRSSL